MMQHIRIIVVDAGFEPGISALEVGCATNESPHRHEDLVCLAVMASGLWIRIH